ncbi:MAG TPA: hypothetical protein VFS86_07495 [Rhodanobacteraceae bacterium]|jgi:hypothetical protein|nr:hypothetical protein [Rhodanobacteraceae bacterium]
MLTPTAETRWHAAQPFVVTGAVAIIAGGFIAAGVARRPLQHLVWMSAYLVLVAGIAQIVFGAGQAWLPTRLAGTRWIAAEWGIFNLGNAGVITGTLMGSFPLVLVGTLLFAVGIALFLLGTHAANRRGWLLGYRVLLGLIFLSSLVGLALSVRARLG